MRSIFHKCLKLAANSHIHFLLFVFTIYLYSHILGIFVLNFNLLAAYEQFYLLKLKIKTKTDFKLQIFTLFAIKLITFLHTRGSVICPYTGK